MDDMINIEKLLENDTIIRIKVRGYSMYPILRPNQDEVLIEKVAPDVLKRGDVVLYRRKKGILVLHRIWKRKGNTFYMVGDNQTGIEGPLEEEQIKGKMIAFIRNGKQVEVKRLSYRLLCNIWLILRVFRPTISKIVHRIKGILEK